MRAYARVSPKSAENHTFARKKIFTNLAFAFTIIVYKVAYTNAIMTYKKENFMRVYNFSAGPSMLPLEVIEEAGKNIADYNGSGMSVMEMSHRSNGTTPSTPKPSTSCANL